MLKMVGLLSCLFVAVDTIYIDLCLTLITELCAPIMADGLGWIKKFGPIWPIYALMPF